MPKHKRFRNEFGVSYPSVKIGQIVKLKSGGRKMVVVRLFNQDDFNIQVSPLMPWGVNWRSTKMINRDEFKLTDQYIELPPDSEQPRDCSGMLATHCLRIGF